MHAAHLKTGSPGGTPGHAFLKTIFRRVFPLPLNDRLLTASLLSLCLALKLPPMFASGYMRARNMRLPVCIVQCTVFMLWPASYLYISSVMNCAFLQGEVRICHNCSVQYLPAAYVPNPKGWQR